MDGYYSFNQSSAVILPLPGSTNPFGILPAGDPTTNALATFFAQLVESNCQPMFTNAARAVGLQHQNYWTDGKAVAETVAFELDETILTTSNFKFPLLYVHQTEEMYDQWTLTNLMVHRFYEVSWIFPPLTTTQSSVLTYFQQMASKAWLGFGQQGYDPKVSPNGPSIWKTAGVSMGSFENAIFDKYPGLIGRQGNETAAYFPFVRMTLSLAERYQAPVPQPNGTPFTGVSITANLIDGYAPGNPLHFADGYAEPGITLTTSSPATGYITGGTIVTITGSGFYNNLITQPSNQLSICGVPVQNAMTISPSQLMLVTSPLLNTNNQNLTGNIVLIDQLGISHMLVNGFTYIA